MARFETSSFGILILTPENTHSTWLHFEAGAIAKSVAEGRVAPILFGLKQSDIEQPLSLFQATLFEKDEIHRLMKTINSAAGAEAREERQLETVFNSFWPKLEASIKPKLEKLRNRPPKKDEGKLESERILQELLILARQQIRILASPDELFGKETLGLLLRIIHEPDGAAMRLAGKERDLVLALCARWGQLERSLRTNLQGLEGQAKTRSMGVIDRFSGYVTELQSILSGTATPESIIKAFGQKSL